MRTGASGDTFTVADWEVDPATNRISRDDIVVNLQPKAMEVLVYLAMHPGQVVSRQELEEKVWSGLIVGYDSLTNTVTKLRKAFDDDSHNPGFIETIPKKGYRLIAPVEDLPILDPTTDSRTLLASHLNPPETHYATSGGVHIAWQVFGAGPVDIVFVPGWFSNVEISWEDPRRARFFERLASFARVILFDKRGTGLSDRETTAFTLEDRMDDVRVVMDAAESKRAALIGLSEGGPMCALFAATYPDRTASLIMIGSYARRLRAKDYPWGMSSEAYADLVHKMDSDWGSAIDISVRAPSLAHDEAFINWYSRYLRLSASAATAASYVRMNGDIDVRNILSSIRVPTLIVHANGDRAIDIHNGRYLAEHIPGARLCEIQSEDHLCFLTEIDKVVGAVEEFITGRRSQSSTDTVVTTILFTDIVGAAQLASKLDDQRWADLLDAHHTEIRDLLALYRGVEVKSTGDGFHATFDGPARAIRCACQIQDSMAELGLNVRIGLHTGECIATSAGLAGIAVHLAARVAQYAHAGEIIVSQTVRDLVAGSAISFEFRGEYRLRGITDVWRLYTVMR